MPSNNNYIKTSYKLIGSKSEINQELLSQGRRMDIQSEDYNQRFCLPEDYVLIKQAGFYTGHRMRVARCYLSDTVLA